MVVCGGSCNVRIRFFGFDFSFGFVDRVVISFCITEFSWVICVCKVVGYLG